MQIMPVFGHENIEHGEDQDKAVLLCPRSFKVLGGGRITLDLGVRASCFSNYDGSVLGVNLYSHIPELIINSISNTGGNGVVTMESGNKISAEKSGEHLIVTLHNKTFDPITVQKGDQLIRLTNEYAADPVRHEFLEYESKDRIHQILVENAVEKVEMTNISVQVEECERKFLSEYTNYNWNLERRNQANEANNLIELHLCEHSLLLEASAKKVRAQEKLDAIRRVAKNNYDYYINDVWARDAEITGDYTNIIKEII